MTTAITTIEQAEEKTGARRPTRGLALGDRLAALSARYHERTLRGLDSMAPAERREAALRWHGKQSRLV